MGRLYAASTNGLYETGDKNIPDDAVEISDQLYDLVKGQHIVPDASGYPTLYVPPPPTKEDLVTIAKNKQLQLLSYATLKLGPLQDAVDLDEATDEEVALLKKWKQYRVALNRIDQQLDYPENIVWPVSPEGI